MAVQREGLGQLVLGNAHRVHDDETVLAVGVGRHRVEVGGGDGADAAPLHLLEEVAAAHVAHEKHHLHRLDVGAGGDHVHGDHDAGVEAVAELRYQVLWPGPGGAVGYLLAEVVALGELLSHDVHDVVGVAVVLGEDDGLGHVLAAREYLGCHLVAEGLDDRAYLVHRHHVAVELAGRVGQFILQLLPPDIAGTAVAPVHRHAGLNRGPFLRDIRFNAVDVVAHVDAVGHRLLVVVLH